jgi:hypothetical protein
MGGGFLRKIKLNGNKSQKKKIKNYMGFFYVPFAQSDASFPKG